MISQAILNLLANAKDIIKEHKLSEGSIEIQGVVQEQLLTLRLRDNGGGVKSRTTWSVSSTPTSPPSPAAPESVFT
ncbi:MAG: hypothetical protein U5J62_05700 [Desulfurivibrio sp.]|nr:hypothetical protein [Desulfurivibrio sp.]